MNVSLRPVLWGLFFSFLLAGGAHASPSEMPLSPEDQAFAPCSTLVLQFNVLSPIICAGTSTGSVQLSATGGNPPYSFNWANGDTSKTRSNLPAGTYVAVVTDNQGCTILDSVTLVDPPALIPAGVVTSSVTCFGGTNGAIQIQGTGGTPPYSYAWANGDTNAIRSGIPAGGYFVTVIDANGCTATQTITLPAPSQLIADMTVTDSITCVGGSDGEITMQGVGGTGPYFYTWGNGDTSATRTFLPAGNYFGTVTDANGCTASNTIMLSDPTPFSINSTVVQPITCAGGSNGAIQVQGAGGSAPYSYFWPNGDTSNTRTNLPAGSYFVTVTDAQGCSSGSTVTISDPPLLSATLTILTPVSCGGANTGSIQITGNGGIGPYSYFWPNGDTTAVRSSLPGGTYFGTLTDSLGCTASDSVSLSPVGGLGLQFTVASPITCAGAADGALSVAPLSGTAPYSYNWSTGDTSAAISTLGPGTYTVSVADSSGCSSTDSLTLVDPAPVQAQAVVVQDLGCDGTTPGEVAALAGGGTPGYSFSWNNGVSGASNPGLGAGTYVVTVTDSYGCEGVDSVMLAVPDPLTIQLAVNQPVSCFGDSNAVVTLMGAGGQPPYSFQWPDGSPSANRSNLRSGKYAVTVSDANGCSNVDTVNISEPDTISAGILINSEVTCFGATDGIIVASANGGTPPYSYLWDDGSTNPILSGIGASVFSVTITDDNDCEQSAQITLPEPDSLFYVGQITPDASCDSLNPDGAFLVSGSGGTSPFTYQLTRGATDLSNTSGMFSGLGDGSYEFLMTDANGCETEGTVVVPDSCESVSIDVEFLFESLMIYAHEELLVVQGMQLSFLPAEITVFNLLGELMVTSDLPPTREVDWHMNVAFWPKGVYVVGIRSSAGAIFRKVRVD